MGINNQSDLNIRINEYRSRIEVLQAEIKDIREKSGPSLPVKDFLLVDNIERRIFALEESIKALIQSA